jgi:hypothetical protein
LVLSKTTRSGAIAQLGERLLCKQEVTGSIPVGSTSLPSSAASVTTLFAQLSLRQLLLFNNPEKFFVLTLSFQSEIFFSFELEMSRSQ